MKKEIIALLEDRGVQLKDIAELVYQLQREYVEINLDDCLQSVDKVLEKREVQNAILTGVTLDKLAEKDLLEEPLLTIIKTDQSLYGVDEILALGITNVYGSIGLTNFGYLDKKKLGILQELNYHKKDKVNTFLDDLVAGVVAAACARIAHSNGS